MNYDPSSYLQSSFGQILLIVIYFSNIISNNMTWTCFYWSPGEWKPGPFLSDRFFHFLRPYLILSHPFYVNFARRCSASYFPATTAKDLI